MKKLKEKLCFVTNVNRRQERQGAPKPEFVAILNNANTSTFGNRDEDLAEMLN